MRARHPRGIRGILLILAGAASLLAVSAVASDLLGLRTDKRSRGTRLTSAPRFSFTTGVLRQGHRGSWQLDSGVQLQLQPDLEWREEDTGDVGHPSSGRLVLLTGQKYGGTLVVHQGTLLSRERQVQALQAKAVTEPDQPYQRLPE